MIGLEYIVKEFHMSLTDVANLLGITRKSITNWTKGWQPIPKKHLGKLSDYFGVKAEYFQKELNEVEKLEIQKAKFQKESHTESELIVNLLSHEINKVKLFEQLEKAVEKDTKNYKILFEINKILDNEKSQKYEVLNMFLICLKECWGGNPFESFENEQLGIEMFYLLKKHGIANGEIDESLTNNKKNLF